MTRPTSVLTAGVSLIHGWLSGNLGWCRNGAGFSLYTVYTVLSEKVDNDGRG